MSARCPRLSAITTWIVFGLLLCSMSGCEKLLVIPDTTLPWNEALAKVFGTSVQQISLDQKEALLLSHVREGLHHPFKSPYFIIGVIGCALWTVAYILFIRRGIKDKIHTVPMLAICLNLSWEIMAVSVLPNPVIAWTVLEWSWVVIDVGLLLLLWKYGRENIPAPEIQNHFHAIVVGLLVLCFLAQVSFVFMFGDLLGFIVAFLINLIMSILFIQMYFDRREDLRGLSYGGAWLKMLGTACTSVQCAVLLPILRPEIPSWHFMWLVYVSIFVFDALYVGLLWRARRGRTGPA